jgi:hypothetical protein
MEADFISFPTSSEFGGADGAYSFRLGAEDTQVMHTAIDDFAVAKNEEASLLQLHTKRSGEGGLEEGRVDVGALAQTLRSHQSAVAQIQEQMISLLLEKEQGQVPHQC